MILNLIEHFWSFFFPLLRLPSTKSSPKLNTRLPTQSRLLRPSRHPLIDQTKPPSPHNLISPAWSWLSTLGATVPPTATVRGCFFLNLTRFLTSLDNRFEDRPHPLFYYRRRRNPKPHGYYLYSHLTTSFLTPSSWRSATLTVRNGPTSKIISFTKFKSSAEVLGRIVTLSYALSFRPPIHLSGPYTIRPYSRQQIGTESRSLM